MLSKRTPTIFCDIDGVLLIHIGEITQQHKHRKLCHGTLEKLTEWDRKGFRIILTTGRRESVRKATEEQLSDLGVIHDTLLMGIGGGPRYLINDHKPDSDEPTAFAINLVRNKGIKNVEIN